MLCRIIPPLPFSTRVAKLFPPLLFLLSLNEGREVDRGDVGRLAALNAVGAGGARELESQGLYHGKDN